MIWQSNHRGVDFTIKPLESGKWKWSFFTGAGPKYSLSGEKDGAREDAISDCCKAIDQYLAARPPEDSVMAQFRLPLPVF